MEFYEALVNDVVLRLNKQQLDILLEYACEGEAECMYDSLRSRSHRDDKTIEVWLS